MLARLRPVVGDVSGRSEEKRVQLRRHARLPSDEPVPVATVVTLFQVPRGTRREVLRLRTAEKPPLGLSKQSTDDTR